MDNSTPRLPAFTVFVVTGCLALAGCSAADSLPCPVAVESAGEARVPLTLHNETCTTICSLNISPTSCDDWGVDWLGNHNLHPGEQVTVNVPPGSYDLLVEECTQDSYIVEDFDVTSAYEATIHGREGGTSASCSSSITVVNSGSSPICHMWIASPASQRFGLNWLGDAEIAGGDSFTFIVYPGTYDVKAEDCDFILLRTELDVDISGHLDWTVP